LSAIPLLSVEGKTWRRALKTYSCGRKRTVNCCSRRYVPSNAANPSHGPVGASRRAGSAASCRSVDGERTSVWFIHSFTQDLHGQTGTDQAHERKDPAAHKTSVWTSRYPPVRDDGNRYPS
jgi:hypothetical protein